MKRALLLLVFAVSLVAQSFAQGYSQNWWSNFEHGGKITPVKLLLDGSKNLYAVYNIQLSSSYGTVRVAKFSPAGQLLFSREITGPANTLDTAADAELFGDSIVVIGSSQTVGSSNSSDVLVIKLETSAGGLLFRRTHDVVAGRYQNAKALAPGGAVDFYVVGSDSVSETNMVSNALLMKVSLGTGNILWHRIKEGRGFGVGTYSNPAFRVMMAGISNGPFYTIYDAEGEEQITSSYSNPFVDHQTVRSVRLADRLVLVYERMSPSSRWIQVFTAKFNGDAGEGVWAADWNYLDAVGYNSLRTRMAFSLFSLGETPRLSTHAFDGDFLANGSIRYSHPGEFGRGVTVSDDGVSHTLVSVRASRGDSALVYGARGQQMNLGSIAPGAAATLLADSTKIYFAYVASETWSGSTIRIGRLGQVPKAVPDQYVALRGQTIVRDASGGVLSNDQGAVGGTAALLNAPQLGTFNLDYDGTLSYVPPADFVGSATARYRLNTLEGTSEANASFYIQPRISAIEAPAQVVGGTTFPITIHFEKPLPADAVIGISLPGHQGQQNIAVGSYRTAAYAHVESAIVQQDQDVLITCRHMDQVFTKGIKITGPRVQSLTVEPTTVIGGQSFTGTVTLTSAPDRTNVPLTSNSSAISVPASVYMDDDLSANFTGTTQPVGATFVRSIQATLNGVTKTANLTLHPGALTSFSVAPGEVVGGDPTTGTVRISGPAPAGGVTIQLGTNSSALVPPSSITVPEGQSTHAFQIATRAVGADSVRSVTATGVGRALTVNIKLRPAFTITQLTANPSTVKGGQTSAGSVVLNQPALPQGSVVTLTSGSSAIQVPPSVTVNAGQTSAGFIINTSPVGATAVRQVTATIGSSSRAVSLTLTP